MKKILFIELLSIVFIFAASCSSANLDGVESRISSLDSRISLLEKQIPELNKSIQALSQLIENKENDVTIKDCTVSDGIIYLKFSDNTQVEIQSGKIGSDAPFMGMDLYNGVYCWTFSSEDGRVEWLTNEKGEKIPVSGKDGKDGKDGMFGIDATGSTIYLTPELGVDAQGYWTVSFDSGRSSSRIKDSSGKYVMARQSSEGGVSIFKNVTDKGDYYEFILMDDTSFDIGKYVEMGLVFSVDTVFIDNYSAKINFTILGCDGLDEDEITVTTVDKGNIVSTVYMDSPKEGLIKVNVAGAWIDGKTKVIVLLSTKRHTITYSLNVAEYEYDGNPDGIPDDPLTPIPDVPDGGGVRIPLPNPPDIDDPGGGKYICEITISGIQDRNGNWMKLFGTGNVAQNVWIELDGKNKGIDVINLEDNKKYVANDIVFILDNSGTMSQEADVVARDILSWAKMLEQRGLDVRFAIAGYDECSLSGAKNFGSAKEMDSFLNYSTGTSRSQHFGGSDASRLRSAASSYSTGNGECGASTIRYANDNFSFRPNAMRTYINFTDEPNQPNGNSRWSVNFFNSRTNWPSGSGVIHTVYSDTYTSFRETVNYEEYPWRMSEYTGGTSMFTNSSFSGVSLDKLPVSDAITHSYTIRFAVDKSIVNNGRVHKLKIVIYSVDRSTYGTLVINNFTFN